MLRRPVTSVGRLQSLCSLLVRGNSTEAATATATTATEEVPKGWENAKPFDAIPGPNPLPVIGNILRFLPGIGEFANMDIIDMNKKFYDQYGSIMRFTGIPGRRPMIMLFDPDECEHVFRNEGIWPIRDGMESYSYYRSTTRKEFFEGAGGALSTQGAEWGKFRSTVNQPMMQPRVAKLYVTPVVAVADDFMKRIGVLRDPVTQEMPDDFINELYKWALESIVMIALDTRVGCLEGELRPDSEAQTLINHVQDIFQCIGHLDVQLPIWKFVTTPTWRRFVKSMDFFCGLCMKYINQSLERLKTLPSDSGHEPSVLERILARDPNPRIAATMAIEMMLAGVDTTSNSVAFLLYHLSKNPEVQSKLYAEINAVLPKDSQVPITGDHLNDLKYLKACIKESMRLSPIVTGNFRQAVKDMVIMNFRIPKGTDIAMGNMHMSNLQQNFPEPQRFIPERWLKGDLDGDSAYKGTHHFAFMPFGFGPRSCIGRRFAELEMEIVVSKIIRAYQVEWHHPPLVTECKLLHVCKSPLKFKFVERK